MHDADFRKRLRTDEWPELWPAVSGFSDKPATGRLRAVFDCVTTPPYARCADEKAYELADLFDKIAIK